MEGSAEPATAEERRAAELERAIAVAWRRFSIVEAFLFVPLLVCAVVYVFTDASIVVLYAGGAISIALVAVVLALWLKYVTLPLLRELGELRRRAD